MTTQQSQNVLEWRGHDLYDRDGDKIGKIEEIYLDQETDKPEWALVNTGLFGSKSTFVPIAGADMSEGQIRVPFEKSHVKDAPKMDPNGELSQDEEAQLYEYYGMDYGQGRSDSTYAEGHSDATGVAGTSESHDRDHDHTTGGVGHEGGTTGHDVSGPETDQAMTRSEEELRIGKTQRESGRARLRKYVVTEHVSQTVPVEREEVRVEREPITDANAPSAHDGPELSEEEHEVVLHEEEVVAEKRVVPKERISMEKDVVQEERHVDEEVRREEVEVDGDRGRDRT